LPAFLAGKIKDEERGKEEEDEAEKSVDGALFLQLRRQI